MTKVQRLLLVYLILTLTITWTTSAHADVRSPDCETDIRYLRPYCTSVLLCESQLAQSEASGSKLELDPQAVTACNKAQVCREKARRLCIRPERCPNPETGNWHPACSVIHQSDWKRRFQVRELIEPAVIASDTPIAAEGDKRFVRFKDPVGFIQEVYRAQCETVFECQQWMGTWVNRHQDSLALRRELLFAETEGQISERHIAEKQRDAIKRHADVVAEADLKSGHIQAEASLQAARTQAGAITTAATTVADSGNKAADALNNLSVSLSEDVREGLETIAGSIELAALGARPDTGGVKRQVDPEGDFEDIYPEAETVEYAVLLVPDPRVPRHRRGYDLAINAVTRGMLAADYVLDRYSVPWQDYLDDPKSARKSENGTSRFVDDGKFGVLLFRNDRWRKAPGAKTHIRALYVVGETGSFGVQREAFARAAARLAAKTREANFVPCAVLHRRLQPKHAKPALLPRTPVHDDEPVASPSVGCQDDSLGKTGFERDPILVIGPNFSGSLASLGEVLPEIDKRLPREDRIPAEATSRLRTLTSELAVELSDLRLARSANLKHRQMLAALRADLLELLDEAAPMRPRLGLFQALSKRWNERREAQCKSQSKDCIPEKFVKLPSLSLPKAEQVTLKVISASATAFTNDEISSRYPRISFESWATDDNAKLSALTERLRNIGVLPSEADVGRATSPPGARRIVLFTEASVFGAGLCEDRTENRPALCDHAREVPFPANIADIRHGARERERAAVAVARAALSLPEQPSLLDLAAGAENGSEFPEGQQSPITAASAEIELERTLRKLREDPPKVVIIAATDVRDRIFLMQRLREELPSALLIDLEADVLISHSSVIHATRGALVVSSMPLEILLRPGENDIESYESFSTDRQALLYCLVRSLDHANNTCIQPSDSAIDDSSRPKAELLVAGYLGLEPEPRNGTIMDMFGLAATAVLVLFISWFYRRFVPALADTHAERYIAQVLLRGSLIVLVIWIGELILRDALSLNWLELTGGISLPAFVLVCFFGLGSALIAFRKGSRDYKVLYGAEFGDQRQALLRKLRGLDGAHRVLSLILLICLGLVLVSATSGGLRVSIAGNLSDWLIFLATTLLALLAWLTLTVAARWIIELRWFAERSEVLIHRAQGEPGTAHYKLQNWANLAPIVVDPAAVGNGDAGPRPGWIPSFFRETPFLAGTRDWTWSADRLLADPVGPAAGNQPTMDLVASGLVEVSRGYQDSLRHRVILAYVAAALCERGRCALFASFGTSSALIAAGYVWPIAARDEFLLMALLFLLLGAFGFCHTLVWMERSDLLSRLLSNTSGRTNISWSFVSAFLLPFVVLTVAIVVMELPGVMQWGGGLIGPLLGQINL